MFKTSFEGRGRAVHAFGHNRDQAGATPLSSASSVFGDTSRLRFRVPAR